jgi:hypothetical protein
MTGSAASMSRSGAKYYRLHGLAEIVLPHRRERPDLDHAGVVDDEVEPAVAPLGLRDEPFGCAVLRHVAPHRVHPGSRVAQLPGRAGEGIAVPGTEDQPCPAARELAGHG